MDEDDIEDWKICWSANLAFYETVSKALKCIVCGETYSYSQATRRSCFWFKGTRCSTGHIQVVWSEIQETPSPGVCATCDQSFMFNVVKGRRVCRREGCRRVVRVHKAQVMNRLAHDQDLYAKFVAIVQRCQVYECAIHGEEVAYGSNPVLCFKGPTPQCDHDRNVCDACLKLTFESAINGGRLEDLLCPDPECKKRIPTETIRLNVSASVFKIYNKKLALNVLSHNEKFRWCSCGLGQIHGPGESNPEWTCLSCKKRHCYICKDTDGSICEHLRTIDRQRQKYKSEQRMLAQRAFAKEAQRKVREDEARTKATIARTTKICPKARCGAQIERKGGCAHFTCGECKTQFCWICKVIWRNGTALHINTCRLASRATTSRWALDTSGYAPGWDNDKGYDTALDSDLWLLDEHR